MESHEHEKMTTDDWTKIEFSIMKIDNKNPSPLTSKMRNDECPTKRVEIQYRSTRLVNSSRSGFLDDKI